MIVTKIRISTIATIIFIALLFAPSAWSWGRIGHQIASKMAEERLIPAALKAVHDLLDQGVSLADISTWADKNVALSALTEEGWAISGPYPKRFPIKKKPRERFYGYGLRRTIH